MIRWQPEYEALAVGHGFRPLAHFPMRPKTKGRVERIVRFVRERFFTGRSVSELDAFNDEALAWLRERANTRIHRVTRERPCDRFAIEAAALKPVPVYDIMLEETRVADAYGLVSINGVRYSVPAPFARRAMTVQRRINGLTFIVDGQRVATHSYPPYGKKLVQDPQHLPKPPAPRHERFVQLGEAITERLGDRGRRYVAAVEQRAPHAPLALLREVLERYDEYGEATVAAVVESLLHFAVVKHGTLSRLCHRLGGTPTIDLPTIPIPSVDVERRELTAYDEPAA